MLVRIYFDKPQGADQDDVAAFFIDALSHWGNGLRPDDPMFGSLKIRRMFVQDKEINVGKEK